ncbi:MAG: choice-of-anchor E domain-containing protein [Pseudomonadota bacterium]
MKLALAAGVAFATLVGTAQAATLTDTDTTGLSPTDFTSLPVPGLNLLPPLELDLFDPSLGTLTGVKISIEAAFEADGTLENTGASAEFSGFTQSIDVMANSTVGGAMLSLTLTDGFGPSVLDPGVEEAVELGDEGMTMEDVGDIAAFVGVGTFNVDFSTLSSSIISGGGNLIALINTNAEITATVEYTFDDNGEPPPIPLPASAPLLLAALGGLGFLTSRRSKR